VTKKEILARAGLGSTAIIAVTVAWSASQHGAPAAPASVEVSQADIDASGKSGKASFNLSQQEAVDLIEGLGSPWSGGIWGDASFDSFSGGEMRSSSARTGSADVMTIASGQVWDVQLRSGMAGRCGPAVPIAKHLDSLIAAIDPAISLTDSQRRELHAGLGSDTITKVELGNTSVTTVGGCIKQFDIRKHWPR